MAQELDGESPSARASWPKRPTNHAVGPHVGRQSLEQRATRPVLSRRLDTSGALPSSVEAQAWRPHYADYRLAADEQRLDSDPSTSALYRLVILALTIQLTCQPA